MVYVVEVKPGLFYAYRSVRLPGHKYPVKQYIGPASKAEVKAERRRRAESSSQKRKECNPTPDKVSEKKLDYKREEEQ